MARAVAQRLAGALGGVRGARPVAACEREVGEADQRRHVRGHALDGRFVAGARLVGAIELDQRLGGAREHDGGGARVVGRGVGERAGGVGLLRQIVAGARARVDVAQRRAAAAILEQRQAIVVVDGGRQMPRPTLRRPRAAAQARAIEVHGDGERRIGGAEAHLLVERDQLGPALLAEVVLLEDAHGDVVRVIDLEDRLPAEQRRVGDRRAARRRGRPAARRRRPWPADRARP